MGVAGDRVLPARAAVEAWTNAGEAANRKDAARKVGELIASKASEAGIETVVFDRGGNKYHGRIAALAEGAREGGLKL